MVGVMPDDRALERDAAHGAVERGGPEGEDAAVGADEPVPAGGRGRPGRSAAAGRRQEFVPCATLAVSEQVPKTTKMTVSPSGPTTQTPGEFGREEGGAVAVRSHRGVKLANSTAARGSW